MKKEQQSKKRGRDNPPKDKSQINPPEKTPPQRQPRPTRDRSRRELQIKYNQYSAKIKRLMQENGGKIPKSNVRED